MSGLRCIFCQFIKELTNHSSFDFLKILLTVNTHNGLIFHHLIPICKRQNNINKNNNNYFYYSKHTLFADLEYDNIRLRIQCLKRLIQMNGVMFEIVECPNFSELSYLMDLSFHGK